MINEKNKNTWCINAEHSLTVGTSGDVRICCMVENSLKDDTGKYFNVETSTLQEIYNSTAINKVRENLRNGIKDPTCKKCWDEESAGRRSKRLRDNDVKKFNSSGDLKILELNLGNTCNIKCRTCSPWSSSQWIREYFDIKHKPTNPNAEWKSFLKEQTKYTILYDSDSNFWNSVYQAASDVEYLDFYGGEPFLIKKQWEFIKFCVDNDYAKNQTLHYNTNCTIWPEEHLPYLKQFKLLDLAFSIDGIGIHNNYIRYPSEWDVVDENINKWYEFSLENDNTRLCVCMTLSPLNIYYIDEMIEYVNQKNKQYNSDKLTLYLNLIHYPTYYNVQYIPDYFKNKIIEKLSPIVDKNVFLDSILNFINNGNYDEKIWNEFKHYTKASDEYRNQTFMEYFPELHKIMMENGDEL